MNLETIVAEPWADYGLVDSGPPEDLAPGRVASLFMGVWLLASSVAQYAGGTLGEMWGEITPTKYFSLFVWICFIGSGVLFAAVRPLRKLMHEVH